MMTMAMVMMTMMMVMMMMYTELAKESSDFPILLLSRSWSH